MDGNVFLNGAKPSARESEPLLMPNFDPAIRLIEKPDQIVLQGVVPSDATGERTRKLVTTDLLGKATIPNASYEAPDGSPIALDVDYLGHSRNASNPTPGPFEDLNRGRMLIRVR
jgi:alpha-N-arabinofuranosidase